jgi:hypothetical protein
MKIFLHTVVLTVLSATAVCQTLPDTAFVRIAFENARLKYEAAIEGQQLYFNGTAFAQPERQGSEHPYFGSGEWEPGTLVFEGNEFKNVALAYDITKDKVLTESYNYNFLALSSEKVNSFSIYGKLFVRIENESVKNSLPRDGFYEVLYNGNTRVIALYEKQRQQKFEGRQLYMYFDQKTRYFILQKGIYYPVKSKASILKVLEEQKQSLRSLIKKNKVDFGNRAQSLSTVAKFYDTLISQ